MMRVFYNDGSTYINKYDDDESEIRTDDLDFVEALALALFSNAEFDYTDITSEEEMEGIKYLIGKFNNKTSSKVTLSKLLDLIEKTEDESEDESEEDKYCLDIEFYENGVTCDSDVDYPTHISICLRKGCMRWDGIKLAISGLDEA